MSLDDIIFNPFTDFLKQNISSPADDFVSYISRKCQFPKMHSDMYVSFLFEMYCRWSLEQFVQCKSLPLIPAQCSNVIINTPQETYKFFTGQYGNVTCSVLPSKTQSSAYTFTELDIVYEYKTPFEHKPLLFEVTLGSRSNVTKKQGRRMFAMKLLYKQDPVLCILVPGKQAVWSARYRTLYVPIRENFNAARALFEKK